MGKSLLFKAVSKQEINGVAQRLFLSDVKEYRLLKGGMFNTAYSVLLENGRKAVFRFSPINKLALLPFESNLDRAELYSCELLKENNVQANRPLTSDFSKELINREYIVFDFIEGFVLSDKRIKRKNKPQLYREAGSIVKRIHGIKGEYYGRVSDFFKGKTFSSWSEFIMSDVRENGSLCVQKGVFSMELFEEIIKAFEKGRVLFENVAKPCLVHGDLWAGNIMVNATQSGIAAVIDTDRCMFGDPDMDLAAPWMINKDFLCGYGKLPNEEGRDLKLLYYRLFYAIIDSYVWKEEYCNRLNYRKSLKIVKRLLKEISKKEI